MPDGRTARLELKLEVGADPIRGEILGGHGDRSSFSGWLELIPALEEIVRPLEGSGRDGRPRP